MLAVLGVAAWFFMLRSGVHATIAGVLLAAATPMGTRGPDPEAGGSPLHRLEHGLAPWVAFLVLPTFALFNAGGPLSGGELLAPVTLGVTLGLLVGKPLGVLGACWLATRLGLSSLPEGVGWGAWRAWGCSPG